MRPSQEFRNAAEPNQFVDERPVFGGSSILTRIGGIQRGETFNPSVARLNADTLQALLIHFSSVSSGILYFPPGRYYVGRPTNRAALSELFCDFVVPAQLTLKFAPGATLVLMNYQGEPEDVRVPARREVPGRPEDLLKVRMEIQGCIDAGIYPIFDAVVQNLDAIMGQAGSALDLTEAGHIFLTRNTVREVFPEWFGAAPPVNGDFRQGLPERVVRRMTLGFQEAINVAHGRRQTLRYTTADGQDRVVGRLREVQRPRRSTAPIDVPATMTPAGDIFADGRPRVRAGQRVRPGNDSDLSVWDFAPNYDRKPAVPITLTGAYTLDTEVSVGFSMVQSADFSSQVETRRPDVFHLPNTDGAVLRGIRGPDPVGAGSAVLRAGPTFRAPDVSSIGDAQLRSRLLGTDSLLAVRGAYGTVVEGIAFDAGFRASRCLTLQVSGGGQSHSLRVENCRFQTALRQLLHIGGEVPTEIAKNKVIPGGNLHWSANQDLLNLQVLRCAFDTGALDQWALLRLTGSSPPVGVTYRTGQSLSVEFGRCTFRGVAAPMFHAWSLRFTLNQCTFKTASLPEGLPSMPGAPPPIPTGLDVFLDNPRTESPPGVAPGSVVPASAMIKNVVSTSPQFLGTFTSPRRASPPLSAVYVMGVMHSPDIPASAPLLPAIVWAGTARVFSRLVLSGCRFVRPRPMPRAEDHIEPVMIDLTTGINGPGDLLSIETDFTEDGSARGHVFDLGNQIDRPGHTTLAKIGMWRGLTLDALAIVDRFEEAMLRG